MRVVFLAPTIPGGTQFYDLCADIMRAAAPQLEIELEVVGGTRERDVLVRRGLELAARATRPEYVLLPNSMGVAPELVPALDKAGIRTLLLFAGLAASDRLTFARKGCARFLGEMLPDDVECGRALAEVLVAEARRRGMTAAGKVPVGLVASMQSMVNNLRFKGWHTYRAQVPDVVDAGLEYGGWDEDGAAAAAKMLLTRTSQIKVLWCFNDTMALGAAKGVAAMGLKAGKDVLIGGIDLLEPALNAILQGTLHVSFGGHAVDGVRALLLLQGHHARNDLQPETRMMRLEAVTAADAGRYLRFMKERAWRSVDFSRFSTVRHPGGAAPELSLRALVAG